MDLAIHGSYQFLHNHQPQPCAAKTPCGGAIHLAERLEQLFLRLHGHADAGILHKELQQALDAPLKSPCPQGNGTLGCKLQGIIQKIVQYLPEPQGIPLNKLRQITAIRRNKLQPLASCHLPMQGANPFQQHMQVKVNLLYDHLAVFQLGIVKDIVDDFQQVLGALLCRLQIRPLLLVEGRPQGKVDHASHAVNRCPDFMAHIGQELGLGVVGSLRHAPCLGKLLLPLLALGNIYHGQHNLLLVFLPHLRQEKLQPDGLLCHP